MVHFKSPSQMDPIPIGKEWDELGDFKAQYKDATWPESRDWTLSVLSQFREAIFEVAQRVCDIHRSNPFSCIISDEFSARSIALFFRKILMATTDPVESIFFVRPPTDESEDFRSGIEQMCLHGIQSKGFKGHTVGQRPLIVTDMLDKGLGLGRLVDALIAAQPDIDVTIAALGDNYKNCHLRYSGNIISPTIRFHDGTADNFHQLPDASNIVRRQAYAAQDTRNRDKSPWIGGIYDAKPELPPRPQSQWNTAYFLRAVHEIADEYVRLRNDSGALKNIDDRYKTFVAEVVELFQTQIQEYKKTGETKCLSVAINCLPNATVDSRGAEWGIPYKTYLQGEPRDVFNIVNSKGASFLTNDTLTYDLRGNKVDPKFIKEIEVTLEIEKY